MTERTAERIREFQVLVKPVGSRCNLHCTYCYYHSPEMSREPCMPDDLLKMYIIQHIQACADPVIRFSWHGGEPTLFGVDGFRKITALQRRHCPESRRILNGIQSNGLLMDDAWCRFLAEERFTVGLSLDGPASCHDRNRVTPTGDPTHKRVLQAVERLQRHGVPIEILCVVHSENVRRPLEVYEFFLGLGIPYLTFLPLVEPLAENLVSKRSVPAGAWGEFLCAIFDVWRDRDIGRVKVQIFEEAARPAFGLEHTLCIFRTTCGGVPILESNGDVYSCDHFLQPEHRLGNIREAALAGMLDSPRQRAFGLAKQNTLPRACRSCAVLDMCNGGCPKDRIATTPDGESGLNYLCPGYLRFFTHCRPFVAMLADVWRVQTGIV